jgi:hypothetical protein
LEIVPFHSMGELLLGETRDVCRSKIHSPYETFFKGPNAKVETDAFDTAGVYLFYDTLYRLEFIEAFKPADITFRGIRFLGRKRASVIRDMERLGFSPVGNLTFLEAGIALAIQRGTVEAVAAYRKGYYDEIMDLVLKE